MQSADRNHNWEETFPSTQAGNSGKSCTEKSGDDLYTVTIASESVTFSNANSVNPKRSFSYTYNLNTFTLTSKYDSSLGKLDIDL